MRWYLTWSHASEICSFIFSLCSGWWDWSVSQHALRHPAQTSSSSQSEQRRTDAPVHTDGRVSDHRPADGERKWTWKTSCWDSLFHMINYTLWTHVVCSLDQLNVFERFRWTENDERRMLTNNLSGFKTPKTTWQSRSEGRKNLLYSPVLVL